MASVQQFFEGQCPACLHASSKGMGCPRHPRNKHRHMDRQSEAETTTPVLKLQAVSKPVSTAWRQQAISFFINQHRMPAGSEGAVGYLDCLPELCQSANPDEDCFNPALRAVASLTFYNRVRAKELYIDARENYGAALAAVNRALDSPTEARSDHTFAAVLLLSMFVDIADERQGLVNPHEAGVARLMRYRGRHNFETERGLSLFSWAITHAMLASFLCGESLPEDFVKLTNFIPHHCHHWQRALDIGTKVSLFMGLSSQVLRDAETLINLPISPASTPSTSCRPSKSELQGQIRKILMFVAQILDEMGGWYRTIPESWKYPSSEPLGPSGLSWYFHKDEEHDSEVLPRGLWASSYVAICYSVEILFYMRLILFMMVLTGAQLWDWGEGHDPMEKIDFFSKRIRYLVTNVCHLIPAVIGEAKNTKSDLAVMSDGRAGGGYMLMWPLWMISNCPFATPDQIDSAMKAFKQIGTSMGYRLSSSRFTPGRSPGATNPWKDFSR